MLFANKIALVTGGAAGIGRAAALAFAREGACVTIADRDRHGGEALAKQIRDGGGRAIFVDTDVTSEPAIVAMVEKTVAEFGGLDAAFNNVGTMGNYSTATTCTMDEWDQVIRLNMTATWLCMKYEIPEMIKRGGGVILNIGARSGMAGQAGRAAYCASKGGMITLTEAMAMDYAREKIRVNCICPGPTRTPMVDTSTPEKMARYETRVPVGRSGEPEDIAQAALYLASDEASMVTAAILPVDGGMRLTGA